MEIPDYRLQEQQNNYLFLLELQEFAVAELKAGAIVKDVYQAILQKVKSDRPDLEQYFVKNLGFAVGCGDSGFATSLTTASDRH